MTYVDGFVLPVPEANIADYTKIAQGAREIWLEYGALDYKECVLDDANSHEMTPFPELANVQNGETVVFAFITYRDRASRDEINAKVMADPRMSKLCDPNNPPFEYKRMACGGFKTIVG